MEIKNILVPVDFSESSKNALQAAIGIAKKSEAKIHMVNAIHVHTPMPGFKAGNLIEAIVGDYEKQVKESFEELESEIIELKDVPHESDRFISYLTDAIYTETKEKNIDLIVTGTRAEHTMGEELLGSNALDIITHSEVPVLVIPELYHGFNPKRIGFASDFLQVADYGPLSILNKFGEMYNAEVMVFHIADEIGKEKQNQIDQIKANLSSLTKISIWIVSGDSVEKGIKDFAAAHKLDLLTLMPRSHNLFDRLFVQSITKSITVDLDIPLLTFHE